MISFHFIQTTEIHQQLNYSHECFMAVTNALLPIAISFPQPIKISTSKENSDSHKSPPIEIKLSLFLLI